jgi:transposase-like protein
MVTITTETTELVETGERRDRIGRRITPAARREELVEAWRSSGLTQAAFARREGIIYSSFAAWVQAARRQPRRRRVGGSVRFVEAKLPVANPVAPLEVRLPDGTSVRGTSAAELAALVRALRS